MVGATSRNAFFELNFRPNLQLVSVIRRFIADFYQRTLQDPDGTSRVALATHELLENAVKYSKDGETTIRIDVSSGASPRTVTIQLRNRAESTHIEAIQEIVNGIASVDDAVGFYHALIARKSKFKRGAGLGLARICAEGEMKVRFEVETDMVTIEAVTRVGGDR